MKFVSENLEQTQKIANDFVSTLLSNPDRATVVGLYGNLGAGKTTFTQCIAKAFGVIDTVTSPTFVLEKIYELTDQKFTHLIHIDAYRIEKSSELLHLGWNDLISDPNNIVLIEWPERVADIMPEHIKINLSHITENSREIEILE
ncbi:MAG: tRNA (adenosine(37)-N6)-threonylcarbamoyltransferase complex ATPase subunit type 1 TsaE [Candidatus Paceibacterota bacterium]|jgi:tRNA threonylcarbamoyladenosine biosynthesis protein TsaE